MTDKQQYNGEEVSLFPGEEFTRARDERALPLEQVARDLHMTVRQLKAIESADFEKLGGKVFARGYIRNYARYLQLDPEHLVTAYDSYTGHERIESPVKEVGSVSITRTGNGSSLLKIGSWVFIIGVIAVIIWWWRTQYSLDGAMPNLSSAPVKVETVNGETVLLSGNMDSDSVSEADSLQMASSDNEDSTPKLKMMRSSVVSDDGNTNAGVADVAVESASDSSVAATVDADDSEPVHTDDGSSADDNIADNSGLQLDLSGSSWVRINDARGHQVFSGMLSDSRSFQATPPLHIVIGNASAVKNLTYAGKEVDLGAVSSNNVARVTVR